MINDAFFIKTQRIGLRSLKAEDINGGYAHWLNDPEVCEFNSHHRFPQSEADLKLYIDETIGNRQMIVFALIDLKNNIHIGNISLQNINFIDRSAELAFILGECAYWGKGYACEAASAIMEHAFEQLNLHRLYMGTADNNIRMQKLAHKLGFTEEGRRVDALFKDGNYHDVIEYGKLRKRIE